MAEYTCPRCQGSGKEKEMVIDLHDHSSSVREIDCRYCGGIGHVN